MFPVAMPYIESMDVHRMTSLSRILSKSLHASGRFDVPAQHHSVLNPIHHGSTGQSQREGRREAARSGPRGL
jgi:hypothetical protein